MIGCEGYDAISAVYDLLNKDLDYDAWAEFVEQCFARFLPTRPELVLDLACGTGRMTRALAARGYDMIGVDGSEDMLSEAYAATDPARHVLYLRQDMRSFELYGTVGATVCCLDSINYLLTTEDLTACLRTVHNYLDPDGLFLFDVNSPYKFAHIYGDNAYVLENEFPADPELGLPASAVYCGWQNTFDPQSKVCDFYLTVFRELENGTYERTEEHQRERCYSEKDLKNALQMCGFELLGIYDDFDFSAVTSSSERWYIAARAKKQQA